MQAGRLAGRDYQAKAADRAATCSGWSRMVDVIFRDTEDVAFKDTSDVVWFVHGISFIGRLFFSRKRKKKSSPEIF